MEFKRDDCTFSISDSLTVRQQLAWFSASSGRERNDSLIRYWEGAKQLIVKWDCPLMPDYKKIDLDLLTDPRQTSIIIWVGIQVMMYIDKLEEIPKN